MTHRVEFAPGTTNGLPERVTVGDTFTITGRVRVVSVSEDTLRVHSFAQGVEHVPGTRVVTFIWPDLGPEIQ